MRRIGWSAFVGAVVALVILASASMTWLAISPRETPRTKDSLAFTVTQERLQDQRQASLDPVLDKPAAIVSGSEGRITAITCMAGARWSNGEFPISIDGQPKMVVQTAVPPYRPFELGDVGADVAAFRAALRQAGATISEGDLYDAKTQAALDALLKAGGNTNREPQRSMSQTIWLPPDAQVISACPLLLGDHVATGNAVVQLEPKISALRVPAMESGVDGARTVTFGGSTIPVPDSGLVTDPDFIAQVSRSREYSFWASSGGKALIPALTQLAEPLEAYAIPPTAIHATSDDEACVFEGRTPIAVHVRASSLGKTYVTSKSNLADREMLLFAPPGARCG